MVWRTSIAAQQTRINQESHYTDLYTKAIEQLGADKVVRKREFKPKFQVDKETNKFMYDEEGNPIPAKRPDGEPLGDWESIEETDINVEVRLGAIYALERIAQDSERDHWPIMESLTAYIRNNSSRETIERDISEPRIDIQAALRVIGRRSLGRITAELDHEPPYRIDLRETYLGRADLESLNLPAVDFTHAHLVEASFENSNLSKAIFIRVLASESNFAHAVARDTKFNGADLSGSDLIETSINNSDLSRSNLSEVDASCADFSGAIFIGSNLKRSNFSRSNFTNSKLKNSYLSYSNLCNADFSNASISDCFLFNVDISGADFSHATLNGSLFIPSKMENTLNITDDQFSKCCPIEALDLDTLTAEALSAENLEMLVETKWFEWREEMGMRPILRL